MPSIPEAFQRPLELVGLQPDQTPHVTHNGGTESQKAEPPSFAIELPELDFWCNKARRYLRQVHAALRRHQLASVEPSRSLQNEADVQDVAAVLFINPIDLALCAEFSDIINLNQHQILKARADKCWLRPDINQVFAVLDYKRPGTLIDSDFEPARKTPDEYETTVNELEDDQECLFEGNLIPIMQQAVHYAKTYKTKYVAFFDWNRLLLLNLVEQDELFGGKACYATLIEDRTLMRPALLGFLPRAYNASGGGTGNLPMPPFPPLLRNVGRRTRSSRRNRG